MDVSRRCFLRMVGMLCSAGFLLGCRRDDPEEMFPPQDENAVLNGLRLQLAGAGWQGRAFPPERMRPADGAPAPACRRLRRP